MQNNDGMKRLDGDGAYSQVNASSVLAKIMTIASGAVLLVVGLMFSLLVFALVAAAAMLILGFLWWKTRDLRRQMRERPPGGRVIDGEVIREPVNPDPERPRDSQ